LDNTHPPGPPESAANFGAKNRYCLAEDAPSSLALQHGPAVRAVSQGPFRQPLNVSAGL